MTEELPWGSRGTPPEPTDTPPDGADGRWRQRTAVDGGVRLDPLDPLDPQPDDAPRVSAGPPLGAWTREDWSPGEWSQPGRETSPPVASRRQLREMREVQQAGPEVPAARSADPVPATDRAPALDDVTGLTPPPQPAGPTTAELALYGPSRRETAMPSRRRAAAPPEPIAASSGRGDAVRAGVERWSLWAAGLGLPPRDASGTRRYPGRERLVPPAVWLTGALGVAVLLGLLTGVLLSSGGSGDGSVATALATTTVTVTNATTAPAVTMTTTRTRTRTVTQSASPTDINQNGQNTQNGQGLGPGSQGQNVADLQQALAQLGLYQGQPTGVYDGQTQAAVQNFQARAGITADPPGVAGPTTLQAINQAVGR